MRVGVAGIGKMGAAIAARLIEAGHEVTVWNRTADKAKAVTGAAVAVTPAELAAKAETTITILTDGAASMRSTTDRRASSPATLTASFSSR